MDPNATLDAFRKAMTEAREAAEGDSNDAEIQALQDAVGFAEALDDWLSAGGFLPEAWTRGVDAQGRPWGRLCSKMLPAPLPPPSRARAA